MNSERKYVETGFRPDEILLNGNRFLVSNGYLGYRGTLEEFSKEERTACILNGVYDLGGGEWRELVNAPNGLFCLPAMQGENLSVLHTPITSHRQSLDLRAAIHDRETDFSCGGLTVTVKAERFASAETPHLLCLRYALTCSADCELSLLTGIDTDVWDLHGPHFGEVDVLRDQGQLTVSGRTTELGTRFAVSETWDASGLGKATVADEGPCLRRFSFAAEKGAEYVLCKYVAIVTSLDEAGTDPSAEASALGRKCLRLGYEHLRAAHTRKWESIWEGCDVEIAGDAEAQMALRYSLYQLQSAAPRHSEKVSIPARSLSNQVYKGAVFWDTEMYMVPVFQMTDPAVARNLLRYRYHTLDGARRKALEYGFRGAFYAWESQNDGIDACSHYNVTDVLTGRPLRTHFRDKQIHVSADIAYAIGQYVLWTGDVGFLRDGGAEILIECARFLHSYSCYKEHKGSYEFWDVLGPDEYHERVHNNTYTNRMAKAAVGQAIEVVQFLRQNFPAEYDALDQRLGFSGELKQWSRLAEQIHIPDPDPVRGIIPQFDGYLQLEDTRPAIVKSRLLHPREYLGGAHGVAADTQVIKQADVVLMLNLFPEDYPQALRLANWKFYEQRTEHGSSLSASAYAIQAARIGLVDDGYRYFMKTATVDLTGDSKQHVGDMYIGGTHPAANGGAYMAAVFGFGGLSTDGNTLRLSPHLPAHWESLSFPLQFREHRLRVKIGRESVSVTAHARNATGVAVDHRGNERVCLPGESVAWLSSTANQCEEGAKRECTAAAFAAE
jgi:trehalose/maltose hydrolase-like predicted phosphorylase